MGKYWEYFKYVMKHKKNVFRECVKRKMYLHAFTHDLSKFSPLEFFAYAENFYGEKDCTKCKNYMNCNYNQIGLGSGPWAKECKEYRYKDFNDAWEHHQIRNKHHWNYWTYDIDMYYENPGVQLKECKLETPREMPDRYILQMICDWIAMGVEFNNTAQEFYLRNYNKIELNDYTRLIVEFQLDLNDSMICNYGHTLKQFKDKYTKEEYNRVIGNELYDRYGIDTYNTID